MNFLKQIKGKAKEITSKPVTVEEIHNEVYSAHKILLDESERLIKETFQSQEEEALAAELSNLGFYNASNVGKPLKAIHLRDTISYYQQNYPMNKFIDYKTVQNICGKYGLYMTDVHYFIAEVPIKNQKEIVAFKVKEKDLNNMSRIYGHLCDEEFTKTIEEMDKSEIELSGNDLKIIAPESQIDTSRLKKIGHQLIAEDPIVLQPVKSGYLIVTAWGDEASDELIVNEKMN
jgi:hypothetical protein